MDTDANEIGVLSGPEALALLRSREVGRIVYTHWALPAVMPVRYAVREGAIWIWTDSVASLGRALDGSVVAFQADDLDQATCSRWSVTVTGVAEVVTDETQLARARVDGPVSWELGAQNQLVKIPLMMVTGRWLGERGAASSATRLEPLDD
jgi:uncharacterized protein